MKLVIRRDVEETKRGIGYDDTKWMKEVIACGKPAVPVLAQCLWHSDPRIRASCTYALAMIGGADASRAVRCLLQRERLRLPRYFCFFAVGHLKDVQAIPTLSEILFQSKSLTDRKLAMIALRDVGSNSAKMTLLRALNESEALFDNRRNYEVLANCVLDVDAKDSIPTLKSQSLRMRSKKWAKSWGTPELADYIDKQIVRHRATN